MCGGQEMREHALFGKIIFNVACRVDRLHCPCNRMRPAQKRVQGYQISSLHHSGVVLPSAGATNTEYASMRSLTK